jgi:hypothetical protein
VPDCSHVVHAEEATVRDAKELFAVGRDISESADVEFFRHSRCLTILRTKFSLATNRDSACPTR